MYVYVPCACQMPVKARRGVTEGFELTHGYWKSNTVTLEEQQVYIPAETSLQSLCQ